MGHIPKQRNPEARTDYVLSVAALATSAALLCFLGLLRLFSMNKITTLMFTLTGFPDVTHVL